MVSILYPVFLDVPTKFGPKIMIAMNPDEFKHIKTRVGCSLFVCPMINVCEII